MKKAILLISILSVAGFTAGPVLAEGETVLVGAACEPEPVDRRHHHRFDHVRNQLRKEQGG